jgi:hypothetical protein
MIDKPLEQITFADVERLVQERWPESKTVDYKRDVYGTEGDDKRELLKDVSSFANTQGGDIIIGVDEDKGEPTGIPGIAINDVDKEKLRLAEIIRHGIEPRIEFDIRSIATLSGAFVIIIRMKESLLFPHRVVFQGKFGEFWARHSSGGKFTMDTDELRRAFTLSDSIYEQIRAFRKNRVHQISSGEAPIPLVSGGKFIMHLIPVGSFRSRQDFDIETLRNSARKISPLASSGADHRLNMDGLLSFAGGVAGEGFKTYTQFYRNGIVEVVLCGIVEEFVSEGRTTRRLQTYLYENDMVTGNGFFKQLWAGLNEIGVKPPIWCFLTFTGVKGARIITPRPLDFAFHSIDRDVLTLPECIIDDLDQTPAEVLIPTIELVWNASGLIRKVALSQR